MSSSYYYDNIKKTNKFKTDKQQHIATMSLTNHVYGSRPAKTEILGVGFSFRIGISSQIYKIKTNPHISKTVHQLSIKFDRVMWLNEET